MKQKQPEEKRAVQLHFLVTPEESRTIHKRMAESGISSLSAYLRKLALNGYIVHLDISGVRELVKLLRICANNLNQYARRAHETGSVYAADVKDLQDRLDGLWEAARSILSGLSQIP